MKTRELNSVLIGGLVPMLLVFVAKIQWTTATYSPFKQACAFKGPGYPTCQGVGTSFVADAITAEINATTVYTVVSFLTVKTFYIVAAASLDHISGIAGNIVYDAIVGYVIFNPVLGGTAVYLSVVGCPRLSPLQSLPVLPGTNLKGSAVYEAIIFSGNIQTGQCNVIPCSTSTPAPVIKGSVNLGPIHDYSGVVQAQDLRTLLTTPLEQTGDIVCDVVTAIASLLHEIPATITAAVNIVIISPVNCVQVLLSGYIEATCIPPFLVSLLTAC